ncbi:lipopolysaccharide-induced tumor necrosis factor-alpha factor homolog [Haliotis rubra]|uniref:lipopolysaccharide-induced tumor necrosis factor-alpha factor homolog n=1 Tax=Haliotis rubra TaxID=36100 RepID=UPI001EE4F45F|nr:lipopolysaccharide-induced tumor necrosis factor-alpha factor homolog [Haliotis rubra]
MSTVPPPQSKGGMADNIPPPPAYSWSGGTSQPMPQQQQHLNVTTVNMGPQGALVMFPRVPISITCQFCQASIVTSVEMVNGDATWRAACILCLLVGIIGCLIPFCMDSTKDAVHKCPNCKVVLGTDPGHFC